jgi:4-hydroxybenzoate polyprenyltransferase
MSTALARLATRINAYERLVRLDKPVGALLLLWPTLWAVWMAAYGRPRLEIALIFFCGTFLMRSAGCAVNDWADRRFDAEVKRTRDRPLAAGEIQPAEALILAAALALAAFGLVLFLNSFAQALSVLGLAVAGSYPFTKRFFPLPQLHLGVAFSFGIPMAFAAIRNQLPWECWALLAANFCYVFAYDTAYAMVDRDDDLRIGVKSSAITLGRFDVLAVMASFGLMLAILAVTGLLLGLGWPYHLGLTVAACLMLHQYSLLRTRAREDCFRAFRHSNWLGAAVFAGLAASYFA